MLITPYGMVTLASFTGFLVGAISAFVVMAVCE